MVRGSSGGNFLGRVNQGGGYVRIAPHGERTVTPARLWEGLRRGDPLAAFRGNYTQGEVMQEVRQRLRKFRDMRITVRNVPGFNIGGGNFDIDFVFRGPELTALANYAETLRQKTKEIGGIVDADTTLKLDKPELRVPINRERAADLGVDTSDISTALRLMVGGDDQVSRFRDPSVNEDYDVELRLSEQDRKDAATISRLYVPSTRAGLVRLDSLVERHGLEKIKTSGDAYMVVSGVPQPLSDHAAPLAALALDIRDALAGLTDPKGRAVPVRIGIASGPVVAGVVGSRKFFYDVWGDAVNTAVGKAI